MAASLLSAVTFKEQAPAGKLPVRAWGGGPLTFIGLLCIVEALRQTFLP
jgi:hypothetical protein